jgi:nitrite reductase/ring-hydroxylating ferredoxin subunit
MDEAPSRLDTDRLDSDALPVAAGLTLVATYERTLQASLERAWENVLDWEHLPWLHADAIASIEREDSGAWGWRARVAMRSAGAGGEVCIELLVEKAAGRYVTRTLTGPGADTEIWTRLSSTGADSTQVKVSFHMPKVPAERREGIGRSYVELYTQLWDEDEAMMRRRQAELDRGHLEDEVPLSVGPLAEVRDRLPFRAQLGGRRYRVLEDGGELLAHAATCPHRLGPLDLAEPESGRIRCPWHGYVFDLRSGRSADGRGLRLAPAPKVGVDAGGEVRLVPV